MFDVISIGTATLDVFLRSPGLEVGGQGEEKDICVRYGAKLEVNEIHFESGGGGTNSAVTFARQGLKVATIVQVGDDFTGKKIVSDLQKEGVVMDLIDVKKDSYTDYSTILGAADGGRTVLVYRGKSRLEVNDIPWEKLETKWFYVSSVEGNLEIVKEVQRYRGAKVQKIAWNPGGRELSQKEEVLKLLPGITLFNVNKEEMEELVGGVGNIKELLKKAQELPCEYVVITDDKNGASLWDKSQGFWLHSGIFEDSPRYETTGAGDSFGSGLVSGFIKGQSLEDCLYLASANASSKVTKVGAKKGLLRPGDLVNWPKEKLKIQRLT